MNTNVHRSVNSCAMNYNNFHMTVFAYLKLHVRLNRICYLIKIGANVRLNHNKNDKE